MKKISSQQSSSFRNKSHDERMKYASEITKILILKKLSEEQTDQLLQPLSAVNESTIPEKIKIVNDLIKPTEIAIDLTE